MSSILNIKYSATVLMLLLLLGCRKNEPKQEAIVIGSINMSMSAEEDLIRTQEALIGNFVADGLAEAVRSKGYEIDFCLVNSGAIRFDQQLRPDGIYPSGDITNSTIEEMLPFGNVPVIVQVTGSQLKKILERSVAKLPLAKGSFLQLSKEIRIKVDPMAAEQQLNPQETAIVSEGSRIVSININGFPYDPEAIYKVLLNEFIAQGGDGFVTLNAVSPNNKVYLPNYISTYLIDYVIINSPITVQLDGRIEFQ